MINLCMLGNLEILHDGTTGYHAVLEMLYAETFQRFCLEMSQEFLQGCLFGENPVIQFEGTVFAAEIFLEVILSGAVVEHLFRHEVAHQFFYIVVGSLAGKKLSGRDIQKAHTAGGLAEVYGCQEVVLLVVQYVISHRHTRCNEFSNTSLHHLVHLAQSLLTFYFESFLLRVFQLVAYRYALTRPDEFRQIGIQSMMRESCHLGRARRTAIVASCQRNAEYTGCLHRIFAVSFVEVTATEEQQRFGMFRFHLEKLSHHRCKTFIIVCHYLFSPYIISLNLHSFYLQYSSLNHSRYIGSTKTKASFCFSIISLFWSVFLFLTIVFGLPRL